jgi:hypothetical protein
MKRGRPVYSEIRQHIVDILYYMGKGYGYEIYKVYRELFAHTTMRNVYYHLKKGVEIGEFRVEKIIMEKGNYSWGGEAEKIYYSLGASANPSMDQQVRAFFTKRENLQPKKFKK